MKAKIREKLVTALLVSSFFALTLFFFGPLHIYITNAVEFAFTGLDILPYLLAISLFIIILLTTLLTLVKSPLHKILTVLIFAVAFLLWLQGNILVWDYGVFDGSDINWGINRINGYIDSAIWLVVLVIAIYKRKYIFRYVRKASIAFLAIQIISLLIILLQSPSSPGFQRHYISDESKFVFSEARNVIIIVLDTFQSDIFQEIINNDPSYSNLFDGFTYFRNSLGGFPYTYASVPLMLTGKYYDNSVEIQDFISKAYSDNSLPKVLKQNNFDVYLPGAMTIHVDETIASNFKAKNGIFNKVNKQHIAYLYHITLFRYSPHYIKKFIYKNKFVLLSNPLFSVSEDNMQFLNKMLKQSRIDSNNNVFRFYHLQGPHVPLNLNENLENEDMEINRENFTKQAKASLKIVSKLLLKLKEYDIYDNSLILVIADHGAGWPGLEFNEKASDYEIVEKKHSMIENKRTKAAAIPLILAKNFDSKGQMTISDAPVSLADIKSTILYELNIERDGDSVFNINPNDERVRKFYMYLWDEGGWDWQLDYFPTIKEYSIKGISWLDSSWEPTNYYYYPGEKKYLPPSYKYGAAIQFGVNGNSLPFQGLGWSSAGDGYTWTDGKYASLTIPIQKKEKTIQLKATLNPFLADGEVDKQKIIIYNDNEKLGEWIATSNKEYNLYIPSNYIVNNKLELTFEFPDAVCPIDLGFNEDVRELGAAFSSIIITAE